MSSYVSAGPTTQSSHQCFNDHTQYRTTFPFPTRSVIRREMDLAPSIQELEEWAQLTGVKPGPLIPSPADRERVLRLFYTYRDLNGNNLTDLLCTDLIVHRVKLLPGINPVSVKAQKRWPAHTEWWLQKLIDDGIKGRIYEHTITVLKW